MNSEEYLILLQFFASELPGLILKLANIPPMKKKSIDELYANLSSKMSILMKSYSANYTRMLSDALEESNLNYLINFFTQGKDVVRCVLPFKTYVKKLGIFTARITAMYSRVE